MFTANERGAGRKKALSAEQIQQYKNRHLNGETILALSKEAGVSRQTLSAYLKEETPEERIIRRYTLWAKLNREFHAEHLNQYHLRIDYMNGNQCCTVILVDFQKEEIKIIHYIFIHIYI